jgi:beta-1,4-mannosyltransferase
MAFRPLRVAMFSTVRLNPYVSLLAAGIRAATPEIQVTQFERLSPAWLLREGRPYAIMHLHWAELQYGAGSRRARLARFASFAAALALGKLAGKRLVYTVHNLAQHEGRHERLNRWTNRLLFAWADALHVHDAGVAAELERQTGRRRGVFVIPHGSYAGYYPDDITPAEARRRLGLEADAFVYLNLGGLRPYKGVEELMRAFAALPAARLRLVIAGHPHEPDYAARLRALAAGDERIRLFLEHVPDARVQVYLRAADVCVFPYRQATTSGAAILALTFGRPIVAPALGPFPALVAQSAGVVHAPDDPDGLRQALRQAQELDAGAAQRAIAAYVDCIAWPRLGRLHAGMYRQLLSGQA